MVTAKMMQQLWAVIESTQVNTLLHFDDAALVQLLLQQLKAKQVIDAQADSSLNTYIKSKLPLIRDTAEGPIILRARRQSLAREINCSLPSIRSELKQLNIMNHWLVIALVAYLIGAAIEGVSTASQLSRSVPELAKSTQQAHPSESATGTNSTWRVVAAIASVSICGAFFWPCRLIHRLMKGNVNS